MSRSEELWGEIEKQIVAEGLVDMEQIGRIRKTVLTGKITVEDWNLAIETTLLKDDDHDK